MLQPLTPFAAKSEANGRLLALGSEARAAKEIKTATGAYDAQRALDKDDCPAALTAVARAGEELSPDSSLKGAVESASRAVGTYCQMLRD